MSPNLPPDLLLHSALLQNLHFEEVGEVEAVDSAGLVDSHWWLNGGEWQVQPVQINYQKWEVCVFPEKKKRTTISDAENEQRYKDYTVYGIIKTCTLFVVL